MNKFYEILESICFPLTFVTIVILFVCRVIVVDGDSMNNTLYHGEKIFISKVYKDIEKGDIVVTDGRIHDGRPIIKRVIATGGDTLKIDFSNGDVYVNGSILQEEYIYEKIQPDKTRTDIDITLPDNCLFLMGDNRNNSLDSRSDSIGIVSENDILGIAFFRISPISRIGKVN